MDPRSSELEMKPEVELGHEKRQNRVKQCSSGRYQRENSAIMTGALYYFFSHTFCFSEFY